LTRLAYCSCRQLQIEADGDPLKVSICHCTECQRRTGSAFGVGVFYRSTQVDSSGDYRTYVRQGDSGKDVEFRFCPNCGSTVYWLPEFRPGLVAVALGSFDDAQTILPSQSVYDAYRHSWVQLNLNPL